MHIHTLPTDCGEPTTLTGGPGATSVDWFWAMSFGWSPDGSRILFRTPRKLYAMGSNGPVVVLIINDAPNPDRSHPAWDP